MDCIVLAGGVPQKEDPLYEYTQGRPKALLDVGGRSMLAWVLDALAGAQSIDRVILVGLQPVPQLETQMPAAVVADHGSLFGNLLAGVDALLELDPAVEQMAVCSGDIPLIEPFMVDDYVALCGDASVDVYYTIVERSAMEARFPGSRRSYVHLADGDYAGGDIFVARPAIAYSRRQLWVELTNMRKHALRQARRVGVRTLIRLLMHRLSLADAERRASVAFGVTGRAVVAPYPELGMDVDKPHQYEICRRERFV
jgi:molybdopterin-guanine dinucleotide biosynthesis protein A